MENPFRFGVIVERGCFADRENELQKIKQVMNSGNHLILISPRRFGKTSLVKEATKNLNRPVIYLDLQLATDVPDFAARLLRLILKLDKWEKLKQLIANFRIVPVISLNPQSNEMEVLFRPIVERECFMALEDVFGLIEKIGQNAKKPIVVLDEFQEIKTIHKHLDKQLRAILQHHQHVNYLFLGSMESLMKDIFEKKKSPFYHFGDSMTLKKIPYPDFLLFLENRLLKITPEAKILSEQILNFTACHPYYTQQMAFYSWNYLEKNDYSEKIIEILANQIIDEHDTDYERLWNTLNKTDQKILVELAMKTKGLTALLPASTIYSGFKRLSTKGYVVYNN
ncbi:MAG: ATP-binding protein, partial [Dysgonamonadaceae bacterium]|nr:ATP-binding protein [Dysgonamonadaceae bacterium]